MHILFYTGLLLVGIVLQLKIVPLFAIRNITPDLVLIIIISISVRSGRLTGIIFGFISGIIFDFFGSGFVGVSSLSSCLAAFFAGYWGNEQFERRVDLMVGLLFLTIFIHDIVYFPILSIGSLTGFWSVIFKNVIPHTFYTLVFVAIFYLIFPRFFWIQNRY